MSSYSIMYAHVIPCLHWCQLGKCAPNSTNKAYYTYMPVNSLASHVGDWGLIHSTFCQLQWRHSNDNVHVGWDVITERECLRAQVRETETWVSTQPIREGIRDQIRWNRFSQINSQSGEWRFLNFCILCWLHYSISL